MQSLMYFALCLALNDRFFLSNLDFQEIGMLRTKNNPLPLIYSTCGVALNIKYSQYMNFKNVILVYTLTKYLQRTIAVAILEIVFDLELSFWCKLAKASVS